MLVDTLHILGIYSVIARQVVTAVAVGAPTIIVIVLPGEEMVISTLYPKA